MRVHDGLAFFESYFTSVSGFCSYRSLSVSFKGSGFDRFYGGSLERYFCKFAASIEAVFLDRGNVLSDGNGFQLPAVLESVCLDLRYLQSDSGAAVLYRSRNRKICLFCVCCFYKSNRLYSSIQNFVLIFTSRDHIAFFPCCKRTLWYYGSRRCFWLGRRCSWIGGRSSRIGRRSSWISRWSSRISRWSS